MNSSRQTGFTIIELIVVVGIVAILAALAYPSYTNYVLRANRADGREFGMRVAAAQERFYTNFNRYTADITGAAGLSLTNLSEQGFYTARVILGAGDQTFLLEVVPQGRQVSDKCGNLTVNNAGAKGQSGDDTNGSCW